MKANSALRLLYFSAIAGGGLAADLWTKSWAFSSFGLPGQQPPHWLIDGVFGFQTSLNPGALFGLGEGGSPIFAGISIVALLGIGVWLWHSALQSRLLTLILGMATAGILGNLYDRLGLHGIRWQDGGSVYAVRDWILVMIGSFHWPNFNIADSLLVCGAILMALVIWFTKEEENAGESASEETGPQED